MAFYSVVFIGFQAHKDENNHILASIDEIYDNIASSISQGFKAYIVLNNVDSKTRFDIDVAGLHLLEGTFEEFVDSAISLKERKQEVPFEKMDKKIEISTLNKKTRISISYKKQYSSQFSFYYDDYLSYKAKQLESLEKDKIVEMWKSQPSDKLLASGYYINRDIFNEATILLEECIKKICQTKNSHILVIKGKRASGKSVLARQLLSYAYYNLHQPALILSQEASYFESSEDKTTTERISGWNYKQIDKFLSLFSSTDEDTSNVKPVILADHLSHRSNNLDYLLSYLENHGKPSVLILTLNDEEYSRFGKSDTTKVDASDKLLNLYEHSKVILPHKLSDKEVNTLLTIVSDFETRLKDKKEVLIHKAESSKWCDRDILLILYTWFDQKFRRFDEIIEEEIEKLEKNPKIKDFYLTVAVFHQYNFAPSPSLCAKASGLDINTFSELRDSSIFKSLIDVNRNLTEYGIESVSTRHAEFSRKILYKMIPNYDKRVELMCRFLSHCGFRDLQFVRDFLEYVYRNEQSLRVEQVKKLKESTEDDLESDYILNHQFAAYLIRERTDFDQALYYLDRADEESPNNAAIHHSKGNVYFNLYKDELDKNNIDKALFNYELARKHLSKCRALEKSNNEYAYVTEISLLNHRYSHISESKSEKNLLNAEKQALTFEALRVVPHNRQNLLQNSLRYATKYTNLTSKEKEDIKLEVLAGKASPLLLKYYTNDFLYQRKPENWNHLSEIVSLYWDSAKKDPGIAIILCLLSKYAFIKNANTRFELLRSYFEELIHQEDYKISFYLLAEYIKLIQIDALALEKYDFLRRTMGSFIKIFREFKPKFLSSEFILEKNLYSFDENDSALLTNYFINVDYKFNKYAKRYESMLNIENNSYRRYFDIELDPFSGFFIKGYRADITISGKMTLDFYIKYDFDGFMATDFKI